MALLDAFRERSFRREVENDHRNPLPKPNRAGTSAARYWQDTRSRLRPSLEGQQNPDAQDGELRAARCEPVFFDTTEPSRVADPAQWIALPRCRILRPGQPALQVGTAEAVTNQTAGSDTLTLMTNSYALQAAERWISSQIKDWSPDWRANLSDWLEPGLRLVGDADWGGQIRDMVQLPIQDPLAWANRPVELPDGHWAIAGIRFRGRDIEKPFVDVIATSLPPVPSGFAALAEVMPHFDAFSPLCLRVNMPDPEKGLRTLAASNEDAGRAATDLLIVGRPVAEMLEQSAAKRYDDVSLVPCEPEEAEARIAAVYDELKAARPQLEQWATPADVDALEDAADEGLLFGIRVKGTSAGVVAAERENAYGFTGFCMQEIVLDSAHRGQQIGVAALQRLCRELPAAPYDVLWGHIHPDNVPSLRNAQESGRKVLTAHVWLTPPGYDGMPTQ